LNIFENCGNQKQHSANHALTILLAAAG